MVLPLVLPLLFLLALTQDWFFVQALGPTIDPVSCRNPHPGIDINVVQGMLNEAFDLAQNAANLIDTPPAFWGWRVYELFQLYLGKGQGSYNAQIAKSTSICLGSRATRIS